MIILRRANIYRNDFIGRDSVRFFTRKHFQKKSTFENVSVAQYNYILDDNVIEIMSLIDIAVQDDFDPFPWLSSEHKKIISEKYGEDVAKEINKVWHYIWETAFEEDLSVFEFGGKCRFIAKSQYPLLEENTMNRLIRTLEYAF